MSRASASRAVRTCGRYPQSIGRDAQHASARTNGRYRMRGPRDRSISPSWTVVAVTLLLLLASTSCRSAQVVTVDDSAIIDAVVQRRQAEGNQVYKVFDSTSSR